MDRIVLMEVNIRLWLTILNHQGRTFELSEEMASEMRVLLDIRRTGARIPVGVAMEMLQQRRE
jgi:hypothetical protein